MSGPGRIVVGMASGGGVSYGVRVLEALREADAEIHLVTTRASDVPAASRQRFIWSSTSSACRAIGTRRTSPVSGSNGGSPETNTMSPATTTG